MSIFENLLRVKPDPATILQRREAGEIYCADFGDSKGRYISTVFESCEPYDISLKISPKIEIRLTYIFDKQEVVGIRFSKLDNQGKATVLHLSTLDWQKGY